MEKNFKLYWLDTRNGYGYPCIDYPDEYTFADAWKICHGKDCSRTRHPKYHYLELHYEPIEVFETYTENNPAL